MKKILILMLALLLALLPLTFALAETAETPAPTGFTVDLTGLVVSIVVLIGEALLAWLLKAVIPPAKKWLESHTTKNQQTVMWNFVVRLVEAAEQIITGKGKGDEKLAYVRAVLNQYNYDIDPNMIEAAVREMNQRTLGVVAGELDIPKEPKPLPEETDELDN